jgi:MraZ protein
MALEQMFVGQYQHAIDDKGRVTLPAKFRAELATGVVVTRGLDGCLFVYPMEEWKRLSGRINDMSVANPKARQIARYFFSGANECSPDRQGRILIPSFLRDYARLDGEAMIVGSGTRIEIWNTETWEETIQVAQDEIVPIAEELADFF